jgi:hypothetical protein
MRSVCVATMSTIAAARSSTDVSIEVVRGRRRLGAASVAPATAFSLGADSYGAWAVASSRMLRSGQSCGSVPSSCPSRTETST